MAYYLFTGNYSREAIQGLIDHPQDREAAARKLIEAAGGKLHSLFIALGPTDVYALIELPDDVDMVATSMVVGAAGSITNGQAIKLLTMSDFSAAMQKAGSVAATYAAPQD